MCHLCYDNMDLVGEHLSLVDSVPSEDYPVYHIDQEVKESLFNMFLREKRSRLTEKQRQRRSTVSTRGLRWRYPFGIEKRYSAFIMGLMNQYSDVAMLEVDRNMDRWVQQYKQETSADIMMDAVDDEVDELIARLRRIQEIMFVENEQRLNAEITGYAKETSDFNQEQFEKFQKVAIGTTFVISEPWIQSVTRTWVNNNRNLIRGLSDEYIKKLEFNIANGFQQGLASSEIIKDIRKMDKNMTGARARLIGRDQIGKLNGIYTQKRSEQAGITEYVWLTAADERVRDTHRRMEGTVNKWSDSSVYSKDNGKTFTARPTAMQGAIPGSQIQCRCTSKPFFDNLFAELDKQVGESENV
jgi:SPP1 gp7 family putative phage head morphogenesis protein